MSEALRRRERSLYLLQDAPFIGEKRRELERALFAYLNELSARGALYSEPDLAEATASIMEDIDNSRHVHVREFILEWLTA